MALFRRKKVAKPVAKEVEEYYKAERRERAGLAWLLALVSLAVVSLLVIGLFFGGKWAYNRFFNDDETTQIAQTDSQDQSTNEEADKKPAETPKEEPSDAADEADTSDETAANTADDEETASAETMPSTGASQPFALAGIVALVSMLLYRFRLKQQA